MTMQPVLQRALPGKRVWLVTALLVCVTVAIYLPVATHHFVMYDDDEYVTDNAVIRNGLTAAGVRWAFTAMAQSNWHPLTWISHMMDVQLFGLAPWGHHMMSLLLHAGGVAILLLTLHGMTGSLWPSVLVAALFAVHPLHVESVAWVAERKDVLSGLFWMLTMAAYLRYARKPGAGRYLAVLVLFALGLMAKPMLVTLPFVMLLLDWWPLSRLGQPGRGLSAARVWRCLLEKAPLLALSAGSSVITYIAQKQGGSIAPAAALPFAARLASAPSDYLWYIGKALWPTGLAILYPHPGPHVSFWKTAAALGVVAGGSALTAFMGRRRPWLLVGWFWYLGTLVPVIGLVQVGLQSTADRYSYLPLIGLFIMLVWTLDDSTRGRPVRRVVVGATSAAFLVAFLVVTSVQLRYWRDDLSLFGRAVSVTRNNYLAWLNLGAAYSKTGQWQEEIAACREALRIYPNYADAWFNLGVASEKVGQYKEAAEAYRWAATLKPGDAEAWQGLAQANQRLSRWADAAQAWRQVVAIHTGDGQARLRLARALASQSEVEAGTSIPR